MSLSERGLSINSQPTLAAEQARVFQSATLLPAGIGSIELSRQHRGSQGEKKDHNGRMPYKQGGPRRDIPIRKESKGPNDGSKNNGSNGGQKPH
jgi:hypothetical protein